MVNFQYKDSSDDEQTVHHSSWTPATLQNKKLLAARSASLPPKIMRDVCVQTRKSAISFLKRQRLESS